MSNYNDRMDHLFILISNERTLLPSILLLMEENNLDKVSSAKALEDYFDEYLQEIRENPFIVGNSPLGKYDGLMFHLLDGLFKDIPWSAWEWLAEKLITKAKEARQQDG